MPTENDKVPGMAQAVERRMRERGLSPGQFADAAGVTPQGLADVRAGRRKRYQAKIVYGVARALAWDADWYELLLSGKEPVEVDVVSRLDDAVARAREDLGDDEARRLLRRQLEAFGE